MMVVEPKISMDRTPRMSLNLFLYHVVTSKIISSLYCNFDRSLQSTDRSLQRQTGACIRQTGACSRQTGACNDRQEPAATDRSLFDRQEPAVDRQEPVTTDRSLQRQTGACSFRQTGACSEKREHARYGARQRTRILLLLVYSQFRHF
jgi:hypothetical protein